MQSDPGAVPPFGGDESATSFDASRVAILPVPYEATVSYGGGGRRGLRHPARFGAGRFYDEQREASRSRRGLH
jgi:hypothetical protein